MAKKGLESQANKKTSPANKRFLSKNLGIVKRTISILQEKRCTKGIYGQFYSNYSANPIEF